MTIADCTVMVVEDHEFQRSTTLQILANLGAGGLLDAADAEGALALLATGPHPDVVICDLDMPGMDGIEFLRRLAALDAGTAIIIASGLDESVLHAAEATARSYGLVVLGAIPKPLTARRLLQTVGLHRPGVQRSAAASGPATDAWADALSRELIGVRARPRVELASGRLAGLEVRAHRLGRDETEIDAAAEPPAPGAVALAVAERIASAGLSALQRLGDRGELIDVTLVLPSSAFDEELVERLAELADEAEIEPARICVAMSDAAGIPVALDLLTRLRVRGFGLGFDGFGSTGATLPALEPMPLTEVKIDAGAVARATGSGRGAEAFAATVALLHDRGLDVVCDGCVSAAEWMVALQAGCRRAQGAYVGPPLAPEDVSGWAAQWEGVR
jgi:EAL domain-containing protein (putative c-di-GMP-specific phosphodiesterase class I)/AmiR/NasT family two-component response regulator